MLGNAQLADLPEDIIKQKYICENHFLESDFRGAKNFCFKKDAVPQPYNADNPEGPEVHTPQKTYGRRSSEICPKQLFSQQIADTSFLSELTNLPENPKMTPRKVQMKNKITLQIKKI